MYGSEKVNDSKSSDKDEEPSKMAADLGSERASRFTVISPC